MFRELVRYVHTMQGVGSSNAFTVVVGEILPLHTPTRWQSTKHTLSALRVSEAAERDSWVIFATNDPGPYIPNEPPMGCACASGTY